MNQFIDLKPEFEQVWKRIQADDRTALQELFEWQYQPICAAIHRLVRDRSLTEDLAQEVFVRFWQKRHSIQVSSSLPAYLRRMAVNEALGHLRSRKSHLEEINERVVSGRHHSGEEEFLHGELEAQVDQAVANLPPKCQLIFKLSRQEQLSYREIADQLNLSIKTVENQMGKALRLLRQELKPYLSR